METNILKELGLNDNEINIYLTLLKTGSMTASEIASSTKLHRTHIYDLLESLIKKGIISFVVKENKKYFEAAEPVKLEALLKEKEETLEKDKKALALLVSELKGISLAPKTKFIASVFQGKSAFISQLNDILRTLKRGEEYLVMGFTQKANETLKYFLPGFTKRRIEKGIQRRAIVDFELKGTTYLEQPLQQIRFFPKGYTIPMGILIYNDRVILVIIEDDYLCLRIENKKVSDNFRKYFGLIWKNAKK